jgi:hypothetical protein
MTRFAMQRTDGVAAPMTDADERVKMAGAHAR